VSVPQYVWREQLSPLQVCSTVQALHHCWRYRCDNRLPRRVGKKWWDVGRSAAHARSHPAVSLSTGTFRPLAPLPLRTSSIPSSYRISLGPNLIPDSMKKAPYGRPPEIGPSLGEAPERFSQTPTWHPLVDVLRTLDWQQELLAEVAPGA
jgi:hypothetical protein